MNDRNGLDLIAAERERQQSEEGWTPEHDDTHVSGEIAWAAESYLQGYRDRATCGWGPPEPMIWPWEPGAWKPKGPVEDLVRAGALIAAEIDRLLRLEALTTKGQGEA